MSTANDVSTVRFGRWWWCWRRRRRSTSTCGPATMVHAKTIALLGVAAVLCALLATVDAAAKAKSDEPSPRPKGGHKEAEPVIEEVNAKQLERLLNEKDFVAVYWCKCFSSSGSPTLDLGRVVRIKMVMMMAPLLAPRF